VRAGAYVVGEDLGTVEPRVREELAARDALSYRVLWFEERPPREYPAQALAAVTTHDLPTIAGAWKRTDPGEGIDVLRDRLVRLLDVAQDAPVEDVVLSAYSALAEAPSAMIVGTLDDAVGAEARPNMPGTIDEANWATPPPATPD